MSDSAIIQDRRARVNGARVQVIDIRKLGPDSVWDEAEGGRWVTWCDRHETFVQHERREDAIYHAADPLVWCGLCAEGMD